MKKNFLKIIFTIFILFQFFSFNDTFADQVIDTKGTTVREARAKEKREANNKADGIVDCPGGSQGCLTSDKFTIKVGGIVPGGTFSGSSSRDSNITKSRLNKGFATIIRYLMIPFGVLSILVMTIGAGFMVVANGQDEILSKGKRIFKMGIISLVVALSSYLIMELVKTILYY